MSGNRRAHSRTPGTPTRTGPRLQARAPWRPEMTEGCPAGKRSGLLAQTADLDELVGVQACSADQGAIDVGLVHDSGDVRRFHRTAVEDAHHFRRLAVLLGQPGPDRADDLLRVIRRGRLAGTDRPDRLVRDDDLLDLLGLQTGQAGI